MRLRLEPYADRMGAPRARPRKRSVGSVAHDREMDSNQTPRSLAYSHEPAAEDPLLTAQEVSLFTGVPEKTLAEWRYHGLHLRYHKLGKGMAIGIPVQ